MDWVRDTDFMEDGYPKATRTDVKWFIVKLRRKPGYRVVTMNKWTRIVDVAKGTLRT